MPSCIAILTNYRRPWNMERLIASCLKARTVTDVIVIDNSCRDDMAALAVLASPGVSYRKMAENRGARHRVEVASALCCDVVACIDDDIFLDHDQIDTLAERAHRNGASLHGVWGQKVETRGGRTILSSGIRRRDCDVDIVNCAYFYTPGQARRAMSLAGRIGYASWSSIGPIEDILLSYAGASRPRCHDVGAFEVCKTWNASAIAEWRQPGFKAARVATVEAILAVRDERLA